MRRILWFRRDLRVDDNPLLSLGGEVLPIFIFDRNILTRLKADDRRVAFIFMHVFRLKQELHDRGLDLKLYFAEPTEVFEMLNKLGFDEVAASGDYDSYARERDLKVSHIMPFNYLHDPYIFKPDEILKPDKTPYLVFTPFFNKARERLDAVHLKAYPYAQQTLYPLDYEGITRIKDNRTVQLEMTLNALGFKASLPELIQPETRLKSFEHRLGRYTDNRNLLFVQGTSRLSTDLRFGTISVRAILRFLVEQEKKKIDTEPFFRQLVFRDFYAYLLFHFPHIENKNFKYAFKGIEDNKKYEAFCSARTGVPIVDAGISELLKTGYMHNRVRMICASFFTKDLLLPWTWGERFFAKHLLDYDASSNILSWQWSAGTGVDPQPYFRIFNPYLQSKKFDPDADYIKNWLPFLAPVEAKCLHDEAYLLAHDIAGYTRPIVIHKVAAETAIHSFKANR